ncbi:DinB family protein [Deinococcus alpinitundrae]|uniref:DinB family protein n=1 Tax=Deinococcus alpinitundrae TaxID=468913 RepID=UPI0013793C09|nr:DinB family protein [Deinococcus alpinitundrae]
MVSDLLPALLDSWDRNSTLLLNLLRLLPEGGLGVRATASGPTVAQLLTHIHSVRLSLVAENAPEFLPSLPPDLSPAEEWTDERDPAQIERMLAASAQVVHDAVQGRTQAGQAMNLHYDHPLLMLQHLIWHEGYHHGQIKLALKLAGQAIADEDAGPGTWGVWMNKEPK